MLEKLFALIHTNVWGLAKISSFGRARYFVFFTNDYSHKSFIYNLKSKGIFFSNFQKFKALAEKKN
jgi:hypothetical protein